MIPQVSLALIAFVGCVLGQGDNTCCEDYCYNQDREPYIFFGSKTTYDTITRRNDQQHIVPDCTPVQFWTLVSQGTSLPEANRILALQGLSSLQSEIRNNYETKRSYPDKGKLCVEDFNLLRGWLWNNSITQDRAMSLTSQGVEDLKLLARRYKAKFPQIITSPPNERDYYFQYSNTDRSHDSYQAYVEGLFGSEAYKVHANTLNEGKILQGNVKCQGSSEQQFYTKTEYQKLLESPTYSRMLHDIWVRLGFRFNLNASNIDNMYDMCRYQKAWNVQQPSPWCIAFTKDHLRLLEYAEDLKSYYTSGYGNEMSPSFGCGAVKDLYNRFEKTINGQSDGNRGTFLFSNPITLQTVLTAMGIARDYEKPTADNYYIQGKRKWRTSLLNPFAANLVAVLYQCRPGGEKNKVMFFLNEVPVEFPECSVGLCSWSTIQSKFENLVRTCNVDDPCNPLPRSGSSGIHLSHVSVLLFGLVFYLCAK